MVGWSPPGTPAYHLNPIHPGLDGTSTNYGVPGNPFHRTFVGFHGVRLVWLTQYILLIILRHLDVETWPVIDLPVDIFPTSLILSLCLRYHGHACRIPQCPDEPGRHPRENPCQSPDLHIAAHCEGGGRHPRLGPSSCVWPYPTLTILARKYIPVI